MDKEKTHEKGSVKNRELSWHYWKISLLLFLALLALHIGTGDLSFSLLYEEMILIHIPLRMSMKIYGEVFDGEQRHQRASLIAVFLIFYYVFAYIILTLDIHDLRLTFYRMFH